MAEALPHRSHRAIISMMNSERLVCALLAREAAAWNGNGDRAAISEFVEFARYHGVLPLLDAELRRRSDSAAWPEEIRDACHQAARAQARYEFLHCAEIERVLDALSRVSITPLLLKGTGLAYGVYSSPILRPRTDSDLLIPPEACEAACRTLHSLGYVRTGGPAGRWVGYQMQLQRRDEPHLVHNIDLHWRISNLQSFAWLYSFSDLAAAAVPVPALHPRALRLGNAHALLLCLLHRASNNIFEGPGFGDRLIWLYDIHLLVAAMTDAELEDIRSQVEKKRVSALAIDGLSECAARFWSPRMGTLIDALQRSPNAHSGGELLIAGTLHREWMELRAIPGTGRRIMYLAGRAFPSSEYMRERFPESFARPLPLLHARRYLEGVGKLFRGEARREQKTAEYPV